MVRAGSQIFVRVLGSSTSHPDILVPHKSAHTHTQPEVAARDTSPCVFTEPHLSVCYLPHSPLGLSLSGTPSLRSALGDGESMFMPRTETGARTVTARRTGQLTLARSGEEGSAEEVTLELGL